MSGAAISRRRALAALAAPLVAACLPDSLAPDLLASSLADPVTLIGAGDAHGACTNFNQAKATAPLVAAELAANPAATAFALGDNAGIHGTKEEYDCFHQSGWGALKDRLFFEIGNHERNEDPTATAYYDYANGVGVNDGPAGPRGKGYYAVTRGAWRLYFLNSEHGLVEQTAWLRSDLAAHAGLRKVALWHKPLFTSAGGPVGVTNVRQFWRALQDFRADVIVCGHIHRYERMARMLPDGTPSPNGIRQFIAGTGGGVKMQVEEPIHPASERRVVAHGVLKLVLYPDRYEWQFIDVSGVARDAGGEPCR
jgi:hypothetical protein